MCTFLSLAFGLVATLIGRTLAVPVVVTPGTVHNLIITNENTINGTSSPISLVGSVGGKLAPLTAQATQQLKISFVNHLAGGAVNAYVSGLDPNNRVVLLQPNGQWFYPSTGSSVPQPITTNVALPVGPQGSTTTITLPSFVSSGRIWFAQGNLQFFVVATPNGVGLVEPSALNPSDPSASINWGFVELTNGTGGIYVNISYVDFVGLPLGITLTSSDGVQTAKGVQANAVALICADLKAQAAADSQAWNQLCMTTSNGTPLRVVSPSDWISVTPNAFSTYWTNYVNQVWNTYTTQTLTIDTQTTSGLIACKVSSGLLQCAGDNRGYAKPTAGDIFGCNSGPFSIQAGDNGVHLAVVPRLCAAFDRSTLLISGGNVQPGVSSTSYYTVSPTNHFSRIVHKYEVDGKGYAFPYDDVNPFGENQSGLLADANPQLLTVTIGGP